MNQKMSLLDAAPIPDGDRQERALIHAYHESCQLYTRACDLRPVSNISETWRIDYVRVRDKDEDAERKNDLWQILQYSAGFHQLITKKSEQLIPLPYWNLIFWKKLPFLATQLIPRLRLYDSHRKPDGGETSFSFGQSLQKQF